MPRHKWTKYELRTLLCFLAKQEHTDSEIHLATELNKALSSMDYAGDIDKKEIHTKVMSLLKERPAFAKMLLRNKIPKLTRTLRLSFERALNFTGDAGEERPSRKKDAIAATEWGNGQQETSASDGVGQEWGGIAGRDGTADTAIGGWGGEEASNGNASVQEAFPGDAAAMSNDNWGGDGMINADTSMAENSNWGGAPAHSAGGNNHTDFPGDKKSHDDGLFIAQDPIWGGQPLKMTSGQGPSPTDPHFRMEAETNELNEQVQHIFETHRVSRAPAPLAIEPQQTRLAMLGWHPDSPALNGPVSLTGAWGRGPLTGNNSEHVPTGIESTNADHGNSKAADGTEEVEQALWGGWEAA
ncbi:MAG: hypothetical protein M1836_000912 [Candelina mexicana]|nr:MAG: hypothetical protein M1836_000912 [Candelina mexicana]